jgi:hypothetical protein
MAGYGRDRELMWVIMHTWHAALEGYIWGRNVSWLVPSQAPRNIRCGKTLVTVFHCGEVHVTCVFRPRGRKSMSIYCAVWGKWWAGVKLTTVLERWEITHCNCHAIYQWVSFYILCVFWTEFTVLYKYILYISQCFFSSALSRTYMDWITAHKLTQAHTSTQCKHIHVYICTYVHALHMIIKFVNVHVWSRTWLRNWSQHPTTYMININEPQLPWLRTAIYHTGLDVKMEVTQCTCIT